MKYKTENLHVKLTWEYWEYHCNDIWKRSLTFERRLFLNAGLSVREMVNLNKFFWERGERESGESFVLYQYCFINKVVTEIELIFCYKYTDMEKNLNASRAEKKGFII